MTEHSNIEQPDNWKAAFFTIWTGQAFSLLGSQLVQFALIWYLTIKTGSATVLATVSMMALLPGVFLSPFIGPLIDRWNRRRIMLIADASIALITFVLAILFAFDSIQVWHIYVIMFLRSIGGNFHRPAMTASTSLMVPKEHLTRVQGVNQMLNGGLNIVAAPLGALFLELLPMKSIVAIDVVTALIAIVPLLFIQIPQPERKPEEIDTKPSIFREMGEGFRYVLSWPGLTVILIMATMINFFLSPSISLMPLLIKDHFGGDALQLGWVNAIFGVGVIVGGLALGIWGGFKKRIFTGMMGLMGIGIGIAMIGMAPSSALYIVMIGNLVMGLMMPLANGSLGGILQATVEPGMQGRVFTLGGSLATAMMPIGLALAGPLSDRFGIQIWFVIGGIVTLLMGIFGIAHPAVRRIEQGHVST
ncbi:MAG: MFS transporter [Anaerolineales bacterium]|nr:MFS transporter [Chloroflexota bacterium]MBL6981546.1 MFS transporter [Anaerolineales bacterium]